MKVKEKNHPPARLMSEDLCFQKNEEWHPLSSNPSVTGGYTRNIGGNIPGKDSVVAWGPGRYAPEASAGIPLLILNSLNFRRRRQEALAPAPSTEKSVPHGSQRTGLASRPWAPWAFTANLFSSDLGHPPVTEGLRIKPFFH